MRSSSQGEPQTQTALASELPSSESSWEPFMCTEDESALSGAASKDILGCVGF